jgi:hypothetical protein
MKECFMAVFNGAANVMPFAIPPLKIGCFAQEDGNFWRFWGKIEQNWSRMPQNPNFQDAS